MNRTVLTQPDQLTTYTLETTSTNEDLRVTRLTCNRGVSFRNRSDFWSQWPSQCSQLWSLCLLVWIWISWRFIHHRMSISNGWVLPLKIRFFLRIRVSRTLLDWTDIFLSGVFYGLHKEWVFLLPAWSELILATLWDWYFPRTFVPCLVFVVVVVLVKM